MAMTKVLPLARSSSSLGAVLNEISQRSFAQYCVIACCTKEHFTRQILEYDTDEPELSFLLGTLRQLSISENIQMAFCPDIQVLRAYLVALPFAPSSQDIERVIVLDMLALHSSTSDFTVQGLSQTFAIVATTNRLMRGSMELIECSHLGNAENVVKGAGSWEEQVPLLSGSIKIADIGQGWANQTTSIKSFAGRWFTFDNT